MSVRDPNTVGQDCTYDALGRDLSCTDTAGAVTSSTYDLAGNRKTQTGGRTKGENKGGENKGGGVRNHCCLREDAVQAVVGVMMNMIHLAGTLLGECIVTPVDCPRRAKLGLKLLQTAILRFLTPLLPHLYCLLTPLLPAF